MGKRIDLFLLHLIVAVVGYLFFMGAFGNIPLALLLTFLTLAAVGKAVHSIAARKRPPGRRKRLTWARGKIQNAARMPAAEGEELVWGILQEAYSCDAEREKCVILLRTQPLTEDDLLTAWRSRAGEEKIALAVTGEITKAARALAAELTAPRVRLFDGNQLAQLLSRRNMPEDEAAKPRPGRLKRALLAGLDRRRGGKNLMIGGCMLLLYRLNGWPLYFLAGLLLIGMGAASLLRPRPPEEFL